MKSAWFCFLGFCFLFHSAFGQAQRREGIGRTDGVGIPFRLSGGFLIVVEGRIGVLKKLNFVLDTGVTHSVVDRKVADRLTLVRHPSQIFDFNELIGTELASFSDVQFGPVQVTNVPMLIADLAQLSTFARHVDVLLGSDLLSLTSFTIDYDQKKVLFSSLEQPTSGDTRSLDPTLLTVELKVQNQLIRLLVDTGFPDILLFEGRLLRHIPLLKIEHVVDGFRLGGRSYAKKAILPGTRMGGKDADIGVLLTEAPPDNVLPGIDGLLGTTSLKARQIDINYATDHLAWR